MIYLNLIGLILNFIGSLFIAFSVIENPGGGHQLIKNKKVYLASILTSRFRLGITILILGFFLQLLYSLCN